ncbi:hypothetical protein [Sphingomonas sp. NFX23]|uniref:hypothetical protein n=1 Tax=Sphingomonas sp. NFX23 TaxID=2819532 RepID=UPI003CF04B89
MKWGFIMCALLATGCEPDMTTPWARSVILREAVKKTILSAANDPESVEFRNWRFDPDRGVSCGEFNGRNGFGGKAGFTGFIFTTSGYALEQEDSAKYLSMLPTCGTALPQGQLSGAP